MLFLLKEVDIAYNLVKKKEALEELEGIYYYIEGFSYLKCLKQGGFIIFPKLTEKEFERIYKE